MVGRWRSEKGRRGEGKGKGRGGEGVGGLLSNVVAEQVLNVLWLCPMIATSRHHSNPVHQTCWEVIYALFLAGVVCVVQEDRLLCSPVIATCMD